MGTKAQEEKKRVIIHAEGEQQSASMIGDAIKANPGFLDLRRIACARCARLRRQPTGMQSGRGNNFVVSCILLGQFFTGLVVLFSVVYGVVPEVSNATMLLIDLICRASPSRF